MLKKAVFTVKLESALRDEFVAEAEAAQMPASQLVRDFMQDFVTRQRRTRSHDAWFRAQVEQGLRDAEDPGMGRIPQEDVDLKWRAQRAELATRAE